MLAGEGIGGKSEVVAGGVSRELRHAISRDMRQEEREEQKKMRAWAGEWVITEIKTQNICVTRAN